MTQYAMSWVAPTHGNYEKIPNERNSKNTITCCTDNFVLLVTVTKHKATCIIGCTSNGARPRKEKPCARK